MRMSLEDIFLSLTTEETAGTGPEMEPEAAAEETEEVANA